MTSCTPTTNIISTDMVTSTETVTKISQMNPTVYLEQLLILDKCENPCWLGIEPGTASDVKNIEETLIQFYGTEGVYTNPKANLMVFWRIRNFDFPQHGVVVLNEDKQVVYTQVFFDENQITVNNLISAIGEPEYVLLIGYNQPQGFRCDEIWGLLYLQSGIEVLTEKTAESIKQSLFIHYIGIEEPSTLNEKHWWSDPALYKAVQWKGYNNYCVN